VRVLGLAARHHPRPIRAFTLTFDHAEYDEEKEAREMAAKVGAEFYPIPMRQDDLPITLLLRSCNRRRCASMLMESPSTSERAVRDAGYKVVIHRRRVRRNPGRYAHFRRDIASLNNEGQDPAAVASATQRPRKAESSLSWLAVCPTAKPENSILQANPRFLFLLDRNLLLRDP